jgi:DNA-3-methyladenine glycosylase II
MEPRLWPKRDSHAEPPGRDEAEPLSDSKPFPLILPQRLDAESLLGSVRELARRDPDLASIVEALGPPPLWSREPGFATLVWIILEQQVSLASAKAAFGRLLALTSPLTPRSFVELDDAALKRIGFSRQKIAYCRNLAVAILRGDIRLETLDDLDDTVAKAELLKLKGVGAWTADIYLLMALGRPDIWPCGDLGLIKAVRALKNLEADPDAERLERIGAAWRPWRAVAARLLWHYYLNRLVKR